MSPTAPVHEMRADFPAYPVLGPAPYEGLLDRLEVSGVTAIEYRCSPAWRIEPRRIADDMAFLILAGRARARVADRAEVELRPGDLAHWRRGELHRCEHDPRAPITVIALHYTALLDGALHLPAAAGFPDRFRLGLAHPLVALAREAAREYALRPRGWRCGLEALATLLLLGLLREFPGAPAAAPVHPALARIAPALEAMRSTLASPLSVPALARRCGLSQAQFRRLFTQVVGCSPVAHVRRLRVAEACRLLRSTNDTVGRIAGMVGYAETAYFANMFRDELGVSPGAFRRRAEV